MGKYYKNSLKGKLTRTLLIIVLLAIILIICLASYVFYLYLGTYNLITQTRLSNLQNLNSKQAVNSKA